MRRAKIICTLGPKSASEKAIENLVLAGMNVARLNFSHGDHAFYRAIVNRVRSVSARLSVPVGILQDLQGPKMRTGMMKNGSIELVTGARTIITTRNILGKADCFSTQFSSLAREAHAGDLILLDDGKISLRCISIKSDEEIVCEIMHGGILSCNKGINLPGRSLSTPSLTKKDIRDVHFGASAGVDAVALSFVRTVEDILTLRRELAVAKFRPLVIAKLEKQQAIENLSEILNESDGVMVARGDLGVELPPEQVPLIQKKVVAEAIRCGKTVIVATQMLESMTTEPRPTRAEASDVANAVLDGADMLMLSAETATGKFPFGAVKIMDRIIRQVEMGELASYWRTASGLSTDVGQRFQNAVSLAAVRASEQLGASAIAIYTTSGATATLVSDYRPETPIMAFVTSVTEQRRLCFVWGVEAEVLQHPKNTEDLWQEVNWRLIDSGRMQAGEIVVLLTKIPLEASQRTNALQIHTVSKR